MEPLQIVDDRFNRSSIPDVWSSFDMNEGLSDLHLAPFSSYGSLDSPSMERRKRQRTDRQHSFCVPYQPQIPQAEASSSAPEMSLIQQFHKLYNSHRAVSFPADQQMPQQYFGYNTYPNTEAAPQSHKRTFSQSKADHIPMMPPAPLSDKSASVAAAPLPPVVAKRTATAPSVQNCFKLAAQPHEKQRKAYQNEKRHLLPHPLTVAYNGGSAEDIVRGEVSVRMLAVKSISENNQMQTEAMEEGSLGGQTTLQLSKRGNCQAAFSLNVFKTTGAKKYVLEFTVRYDTKQGHYEEKIISRPFAVSSNRIKPDIERPIIAGLNPNVCLANGANNQIWIRGKKFMKQKDNLIVKFGDKVAKIEECEGNLLVVHVPQLGTSLHEPRTVAVTVTNIHMEHQLVCKEPFTFTYLPSK